MEITTLLSLAFLLICVLFILLLVAVSKINNLHKKVTDVSPNDLYPFMEELRELVIESERVADRLEDEIKQKEELLEDITSLIEDKLKRLESIDDTSYMPQPEVRDTYTPSISRSEPETISERPVANEPERIKQTMRGRISELVQQGLSDSEIASKLGISTTEVQIVKRMDLG